MLWVQVSVTLPSIPRSSDQTFTLHSFDMTHCDPDQCQVINTVDLVCGWQPPTNNVIPTVLFQRENLSISLSIYLTMVKIFIGNLPDGGVITNDDVRTMFEAHGLVTECEIIKNYG